MSEISRVSLLSALDLIEESDSRNLAWGLFDESWTRDGLVHFLRDRLEGVDPELCINGLLEENLLVQLPREWPTRFRTRMAETVRLFSQLRQLFPGKAWQSGSPLVSDLRFLRKPRAFPRRNLPAADVLSDLAVKNVSDAVLIEIDRILAGRALSRFQLDATAGVLAAISSEADRGVVVGAGTGSGKTLAFYLPALARCSVADSGPRILAIYPRNELLKDQLATALQEVRRLRFAGGRLLTVGAYFGPTPHNGDFEPDVRSGWRLQGKSWICPFLKCPADSADKACGGFLAWNRSRNGTKDSQDWGELVCQQCGSRVTSEELRLTRQSMHARPPDILFTTTEMLNQQLSDGWSRHVFGLGTRGGRPPSIVLLDEVHTYSGTSGAQVAFLLRRWRKLLGRPVTWVGLSATLANASTYFADLCGLPPEAVADIRPDPADMDHRGSEYQVLLRGDPASQSALLSTTIQSLMLLRRVLNEKGSDPQGVYGTRVFAFLENLDLVNRLYRQLLNAEGRDPFGKRDPKGAVLAALRIEDHIARSTTPVADYASWNGAGQHWWLTERLGFGSRSLGVSRTSSQDTGVDSGADIVIATAALEVGYDDPLVGAVLQHKAPRDVSQFIQRRGRAGRSQTQRPWTVVVLSDYGRDRQAYQSYESILDPSVQVKSLPLGNQSVRKMQAAMCLIDWVAITLGIDGAKPWFVRKAWAQPTGDNQYVEESRHLLGKVLDGGSAQRDLISFVQTSMRLTSEETHTICWDHPRSLILEVVPTMYRRLSSDWATVQALKVTPRTDFVARQPLPEFIPTTLFTDLVLPEVKVDPPLGYDSAAATSVPVSMGLNELTPGKVTLRWAVRKVKGLWIEIPESGIVDLDKQFATDSEIIHDVKTVSGTVALVRPLTIRPEVPPPHVKATSNGSLNWKFLLDSAMKGTPVPRPRHGPLGELVSDVQAFLNVDKGPLRTWRYALDGTAEIVTREGRDRRNYTFSKGGNSAAIGFASTIDALVVTVSVPDSIAAFDLICDADRLRQLRTDRFSTVTRECLEQQGVGPFAAAWITDVVLAIAAEAVFRGLGIGELQSLASGQWQVLADSVIDGVMLATTHTAIDDTPLRDVVLDALKDTEILRTLGTTVFILGEDPDDAWFPWIRSRYLQTMAAAWQFAAQQVCLEFNVDAECLVDIVDDSGPSAMIVISDTVPGGGGLVETLARRISDDPRNFDSLVASAAEPSDTEETDPTLRRVLDLLVTNGQVAEAASRFRTRIDNRLDTWQALVSCLSDEGVSCTHVNLAALTARVFQPGSGSASDDLLRLLLAKWDEFNALAGFAIDHRSVCAFLAKDEAVLDILRRIASANQATPGTRAHSVLLGLLWTRASARRPESLRASNQFVRNPPSTERTLLLGVLPEPPHEVDVDVEKWRLRLAHVLREQGSARVTSGSGAVKSLAGALLELMVDPLEIGWLYAFPQVDRVGRENGKYAVSVTLREASQ